jgi:hypothetical protein
MVCALSTGTSAGRGIRTCANWRIAAERIAAGSFRESDGSPHLVTSSYHSAFAKPFLIAHSINCERSEMPSFA